jgi:hypothetical protein
VVYYLKVRGALALNVRKGLSRIHWRHTIGGIAWLLRVGAGIGFIESSF